MITIAHALAQVNCVALRTPPARQLLHWLTPLNSHHFEPFCTNLPCRDARDFINFLLENYLLQIGDWSWAFSFTASPDAAGVHVGSFLE
jgi:hypothetical protein